MSTASMYYETNDNIFFEFTSQIYFDLKVYQEVKINEEVEYELFYLLCVAYWS